jgi:NADH dehydrogenase [ubiquinone] 1 alpha subcomplex assembly factor 7
MRQGYFLTRLGAWERSKILGKSNPARAEEIANGVTRLTSPEDMGARFKVVCLAPHGAPTPAGF